ncbi:MAG: phage holin [Coriobacteriia bacterium]|nr:phage holin [Coriobacteriia bacterium]
MNEQKDNHKLILPDRAYEALKFLALWVFPEAVLLYSLGAATFGWPQPEFVTACFGAVFAVSGGLAGVSTHNYHTTHQGSTGKEGTD